MNKEARSDIEWWFQFIKRWNGVSIMREVREAQPSVTVTTDASGDWGCGGFWDAEWFMLPWPGASESCHITVKELVPVTIAAAIWGRHWRGRVVRVWSDNTATVSIINLGTSHNADAMHLARCLAFIKAQGEFELVAAHIKGTENTRADALSRNKLPLFRLLHPQAAAVPSAIPEELLDLLLLSRPDWNSRRWSRQWSAIFGTA